MIERQAASGQLPSEPDPKRRPASWFKDFDPPPVTEPVSDRIAL